MACHVVAICVFWWIVLSPVKEVRTCVSSPLIEEGHPTVDAIGACCGGACACACGGFRSAQEELASLQGLCQPAIKTSHLLQLFEDALPREKIPTAFFFEHDFLCTRCLNPVCFSPCSRFHDIFFLSF